MSHASHSPLNISETVKVEAWFQTRDPKSPIGLRLQRNLSKTAGNAI